MTKYYDVSLTITNQLVTWPGDPSVHIERASKIEDGANANVSRMDMGVHTGTHVDAPYHFLQEGATIETLPLDVLIGQVQVVQLADSIDVIDPTVLDAAGIGDGVERVLFKTRNSKIWTEDLREFQTNFVGVDARGAEYLVQRGFKLVGIDYLSIAPYKRSRPTHQTLLKAKIVIIEGLDLSQVEPGFYTLYCLPMKLGGSDGAPARVVLAK